MYRTYGVLSTSTATHYPLPPAQLGPGHMQSAGVLLLQLLFLQRALQEKGCYSPSDQSLFDAVYEAGQLEKRQVLLSCKEELVAKHEELVQTHKKLETLENGYKKDPHVRSSGIPKSCEQGVFPRQKKLVCLPKTAIGEQGKEINLLQSMTQFFDAFSKDTGGLCNKNSALVTAVRLGDTVATQLILDTGVNASAVPTRGNPYQRTALHWAAAAGHKDVAEALLEYGANLEAKTTGGATPLLLAIRDNANKDVIKALLNNGADVDARDNRGHTVLHVAAQKGDLDLMQLLVDYGADPQAGYGQQQITPRKLAAMHGHNHVVEWLKRFENQRTPNKKQRVTTETSPHFPVYRQLPFPESGATFDEVSDTFTSEEPIADFPEDAKESEIHTSSQTTAAEMLPNTTHLSNSGKSEDEEEFTDTSYSPDKIAF